MEGKGRGWTRKGVAKEDRRERGHTCSLGT
jgi:hypothetical protein